MKNIVKRLGLSTLIIAIFPTLLTSCVPALNDLPSSSEPGICTVDPSSKSVQVVPISAMPDCQVTPLSTIETSDNVTCHYVPLTIFNSTAAGLSEAEYLVEQLPRTPVRHIYALAPQLSLQVRLDLKDFINRPAAASTRIDVSYSNSVTDEDIGTIDVALTETDAKGHQTIYYGQAKFVADSVKGISLHSTSYSIDYSHRNYYDVFMATQSGQLPPTLNETIHQKDTKIFQAYGHPFDVVHAELADLTDYLYPEIESSHTQPIFLQHWSDFLYYKTNEAVHHQDTIYRLPDIPAS